MQGSASDITATVLSTPNIIANQTEVATIVDPGCKIAVAIRQSPQISRINVSGLLRNHDRSGLSERMIRSQGGSGILECKAAD